MSWRVRDWRRLLWSMVGGWLALMADAGNATAAPCYDWSRSIEPARIQSVATGSACRLDGSTAYVAGERLWIVDVSGTGEPAVYGSVVLPAAAQDLALANGMAYVACGAAGIVEVDVRSPAQAVIVRTYTPASPIVAVVSIDGCVIARDSASGLHVLDTAAGPGLGAASITAWPSPILAMCEAGGFLIISESTKISVVNVRNASALMMSGTLAREASSRAQLCSDGSALFELAGHLEWDDDGYSYYLVSQMARYEISSIGGLDWDSAVVPVRMGDDRIAAGNGIVVAISNEQSASLWSADDLAFLGRLSSKGNAADIDAGRVIATGYVGLAVTDRLSHQPLPPMQVVHGGTTGWSGQLGGWGDAAERKWPWILQTTSTASYSPGYWGGTWRLELCVGLAGNPAVPDAAVSGAVNWFSPNNAQDPCAWGNVSFLGQSADRAVI
ncbi:MAG: hypothetical protein IPH86_19220 [bacterium]|nr:hypothetical protein [bacterium]